MNARTSEVLQSSATRTADRVALSIRRNPVTVAGAVTGAVAAFLGAVTATVVLGERESGARREPPLGRLALALTAAGVAGALLGRTTQRWTWSDDRVTDELLDAELVLWDEFDLREG